MDGIDQYFFNPPSYTQHQFLQYIQHIKIFFAPIRQTYSQTKSSSRQLTRLMDGQSLDRPSTFFLRYRGLGIVIYIQYQQYKYSTFFMLNQLKLLLTFTFALSCKSMRFVQRVTVKRGGGFSCIIFKQKKVLSCLRFLFTTGCMSFFPISFCPIFLQGTFFQSMYRCTQVRVKYEFDRNSNTLA